MHNARNLQAFEVMPFTTKKYPEKENSKQRPTLLYQEGRDPIYVRVLFLLRRVEATG